MRCCFQEKEEARVQVGYMKRKKKAATETQNDMVEIITNNKIGRPHVVVLHNSKNN